MMQKIRSNVSPEIIEKLGDNSYYYNYDIQPEEVETVDMNTNETKFETQYSFIQIHLQGQPDYKDCVKAVIRAYVSLEEEFDLINSYNKYKSGNSIDESLRQEYEQYLGLLEEIKTKIKTDFSNYGKA